MLKIDKNIRRPEPLPKLFPRNHLAKPIEQQAKQLERLLRQPNSDAVLAKLPSFHVEFEKAEAEDVFGRGNRHLAPPIRQVSTSVAPLLARESPNSKSARRGQLPPTVPFLCTYPGTNNPPCRHCHRSTFAGNSPTSREQAREPAESNQLSARFSCLKRYKEHHHESIYEKVSDCTLNRVET